VIGEAQCEEGEPAGEEKILKRILKRQGVRGVDWIQLVQDITS
jgi:hypothetical protein